MSPQIHLSPQPLPLKGDEGEIRALLMDAESLDPVEALNIPCPRLVTVSWGPRGELVYASNLSFEEPQNIRLYEQSRSYLQLRQMLTNDAYADNEVSIGLGERQVTIQWDSHRLWSPELVDQVRLEPSVEACTQNMNLFSANPWRSEIWRLLRAVIEPPFNQINTLFFQPDVAVVQNLIHRANSLHDSSTLACILRMIHDTHLQNATRRGFQKDLTELDWKGILEGHVRVFADYLYRIGRYIIRNKILQCIEESDYCKSMVENLRMPWLNHPVSPIQDSEVAVYIKNPTMSGFDFLIESRVVLTRLHFLVTECGEEELSISDVLNGGRPQFQNTPSALDLAFSQIQFNDEVHPSLGSGSIADPPRSIHVDCELWNGLFEVSVVIEKQGSSVYFVQLPLLMSGTLQIEQCSVCCLPVKKNYTIVCPSCNHGGHIYHITSWLVQYGLCPFLGCDCQCTSFLDLSETQLDEEVESDSSQDSY